MPARTTLREYLFPTKGVRVVGPAILLLLLLFFYVQGPLIFGDLWVSGGFIPGGFSGVILLYILLLFASFALNPSLLTRDPAAPIWLELLAYTGPAVIVNVLLLLAGVRIALGPADPAFSYQIIALQISISGAEEVFFRGGLGPGSVVGKITKKGGAGLGPLYTAAIFAGFHALAYGLNPVNLIFAFVIGMMLYVIYEQTREKYGLAINTGLHLGLNLGMLGISLIPFLF